MFGMKEEAVKGRGIEILQRRSFLYKKMQRPSFYAPRLRKAHKICGKDPLLRICWPSSLSNLFIPHNKKRGKNTILPDYIVGDERISADIPKKRGWTFIYFIKINNAKEAQKADSIGIHLTPMFQKYTIDIYP